MKHYFPIPYAREPDDEFRVSDVHAWLHRWGWNITAVMEEHDWLHLPRANYQITIDGICAGVPAKLNVFSGAVLVYDTEERSLGVTDRRPREPEDEIPAQWRESEDAVPARFVDRNADMSLISDGGNAAQRRLGRVRRGQKSPEGVTRPPLITTRQETPPPPWSDR